MRASFAFGLSLILLIGLPGLVRADDIVLPREDIDRVVKPLIDDGNAQSIVVAIIDSSGTRVIGYGHISAKNEKSPDGKTVFEIGSMSKVFTATLMASMEGDGLVKSEDPVQKYLPEKVKLAEKDRPISLLDLATHMSGLPRMPDNFKSEDAPDPYAHYTVANLYEFLNSWKPSRGPGDKMEYSNVAVGLLGSVLATRAGTSYETLLHDRIIAPLNLADTTIKLNDSQKQRLAPGHDSEGKEVANWNFTDAFAGAGAIRSTADDLVTFVKTQLEPPAGPLGDAIRKTQQPVQEMIPGRMIGWIWMIDHDGDCIWHNGETAGYHSFVAFNPKIGSAVIMLSNTGTAPIDQAGSVLVRKQLGFPEPPPAQPRDEMKLTEQQLDRFVGQYDFNFAKLDIRRRGEKLFAQLTGQPEFQVFPDSEKSVFWKVVDAQLAFEFDNDTAPAKSCTLFQNGQQMPATRVAPSTQPGK